MLLNVLAKCFPLSEGVSYLCHIVQRSQNLHSCLHRPVFEGHFREKIAPSVTIVWQIWKRRRKEEKKKKRRRQDYIFAFSLGRCALCQIPFSERTRVFVQWPRRTAHTDYSSVEFSHRSSNPSPNIARLLSICPAVLWEHLIRFGF